jgi:hypothetical protein
MKAMKQIIGTVFSLVILTNSMAFAEINSSPKPSGGFLQGFKRGITSDFSPQPASQQAVIQRPEKPAEVTAQIQKAYSSQEFERFITVDKQVQPIKSKLKKMYSAYKVTITSDYPGTLAIKNANINNGVPGVAAYQAVHTSAWRGLLWALIPYAGIIASPVAGITYAVSNSKAGKESAQYASQIPLGDLKRGEPLTFSTLVPAGQTPVMTIKLIDKDNSQEYILSSI